MRILNTPSRKALGLSLILLTALLSACNNSSSKHHYTGSAGHSAEPTIIATNPAPGATAVATNNSILATFNVAMNSASLNSTSFTVVGAGEVAIVGVVHWNAANNTVVFKPSSDLSASTVYTATITTAVKSMAGKSLLANHVWTFTSSAIADITAPTVSSTTPNEADIDVVLNRIINATLDESIDPTSVNATSFILTADAGATSITGDISVMDTVLSFKPNNNLVASTLYTATLTTGVTDLAGNALATNHSWTFTTGVNVAVDQLPVDLLTAGDFVILSEAGITNAPISVITGNIGASPITAAAMNAITCAEITGTIYGADAAYVGDGDDSCFKGTAADNTLVANAVLDMGIAYNDAKGRTTPDYTELHAGDISGKTLVPGLYKWSSSVLINTDVTLAGDANAVWIFQIAGNVTQAANTSVILSGGAVAKNIFWQVEGGTGVALDTDAIFEGIVLAKKGITVNTGTTVNGRLFSHTAITLNMNTIAQPAP